MEENEWTINYSCVCVCVCVCERERERERERGHHVNELIEYGEKEE